MWYIISHNSFFTIWAGVLGLFQIFRNQETFVKFLDSMLIDVSAHKDREENEKIVKSFGYQVEYNSLQSI